MNETNSRNRWAGGSLRDAAVLLILGLVPRWIHLLTIRRSPFFDEPLLDARMYDEWAWRIAEGQWLGQGPFFQDPLYPYGLATIYSVFGHNIFVALMLQLTVGAAVAPLVYLAGRPTLGRGSALAAGVVAALYAPAIYYEGLLLKTSTAVLLVALALWLLSRAIAGTRPALWVLTGAAFGLATLTRGNLLPCVMALALWAILEPRWPDPAPPRSRPRFVAACALVLGSAIPISTATIYNRVAGDEWILTTSNAGQNFYIGNNPLNDNGEYVRLPFVAPNPKYEERDFAEEAERRVGERMSAGEVSRFWFGQGLAWIRENPGAWFRLGALKWKNYWDAYEIPDNFDYYLYRESAPVLRAPLLGFGLVAPFALLGGGLTWRLGGWPRALTVFAMTYTLAVVGFFVFSRFRMPMMPALFPLAGYGALETVRRVREAVRERSARRGAFAVVGLLLLFAIFVHLPVRAVETSRTYRVARALGLPTRGESTATGHFNRGVALAARAKEAPDPERWLALAESELRRAVAAEDGYAPSFVELGKVLARRNQNDEAIRVYLQAAALEPANYRIQHALGLLHRRVGDMTRAAAAFRRSIELEPRFAPSAVELGSLLLAGARPAEAIPWFEHALSVAPSNRAAVDGLREARAASEP